MTMLIRKKSAPMRPKADVTDETVARELADVKGFEQGRKLQSQIIQLGEKMRELRETVLRITQTEAARLVGMDQSELSRIEAGTGARGPSYSTISRIINAYESFLQTEKRDSHVALSIQYRRSDTDELQKSFLAGGE